MSVYTNKTAEDRRYEFYEREENKKTADAEALQKRKESFDPTLGMSTSTLALAGVGRGMVNVARNIGNIAGVYDDEQMAEFSKIDAPLLNTTPGYLGNIAGETVATAPIGGAFGRGASALIGPAARNAHPLVSGAARYGTEGAVEGAIVADPDKRLEGAGVGALVGGGVGTIGGRGVQGTEPSPNAQLLRAEGVHLTPGQMNPGGAMAAMEQSSSARMMSGVGEQREQGLLETFNAMINRSLPPGATPVAVTNPQQMTDDLYQNFRRNYQQAHGYNANIRGLQDEINTSLGGRGTTPGVQQADTDWIANHMGPFEGQMQASSEDLLALRSKIRTRVRARYREGTVESMDGVEALERAEEAVTRRINRALPNDVRHLIEQTDAQYGNYKIIDDISWKTGDTGNVTPNRMSTAVRKAADSKGQYARGGGGPLREISAAANDVFGVTTPPTGMSNLVPAMMSGVGGAAGATAMGPIGGGIGGMMGAALPAGIASAGNTAIGRNLYTGDNIVQDILQRAAEIPLIPELLRGLGVNATVEETLNR